MEQESVIYHDRDGKQYPARVLREYVVKIQVGDGSGARSVSRGVADLSVEFTNPKADRKNVCTVVGASERDRLLSIPGKPFFARLPKQEAKKDDKKESK